MAFTQDELQSLNGILEQKLSAQRRELEQIFDSRLQTVRRELEQRFTRSQQECTRTITQQIDEQHTHFKDSLEKKLDRQYTQILQALAQNERTQQQQQSHYEEVVEHSLAAQLLAFEQLLSQRVSAAASSILPTAFSGSFAGAQADFDTIEVQTEIPWDELVELINQSFDERFTMLRNVIATALKDMERYLTLQIRALQDIMRVDLHDPYYDNAGSLRSIVANIEQLEQLIEALQVTMTANSTLLSNRLNQHQQLPFDRAHPAAMPEVFPQLEDAE